MANFFFHSLFCAWVFFLMFSNAFSLSFLLFIFPFPPFLFHFSCGDCCEQKWSIVEIVCICIANVKVFVRLPLSSLSFLWFCHHHWFWLNVFQFLLVFWATFYWGFFLKLLNIYCSLLSLHDGGHHESLCSNKVFCFCFSSMFKLQHQAFAIIFFVFVVMVIVMVGDQHRWVFLFFLF